MSYLHSANVAVRKRNVMFSLIVYHAEIYTLNAKWYTGVTVILPVLYAQ